MILSIDSSLATFKHIEFRKGLNVLLSDTTPDASNKQTRNSAGKTSLVEIIHFLFGSDCDPDSIFRNQHLIDHTFAGELNIWGTKISVERSGAIPSRIYLLSGLEGRDDLPIQIEKGTERRFLSNTNWKAVLGSLMFGLPINAEGTVFDESYTPSFRSMFSYFVRRHNSGAFMSPERQAERQQPWDYQENLSYLFDFDWRISREFREIKARENALKALKKATKDGAFGQIIGTVAELRSELAVAEKKAATRKSQLENFEVLDSYNDLVNKSAQAKSKLQALSRENISLRESLNHLEESLAAEKPPDPVSIDQLYQSAGIELPGVALKRLDEVQEFYNSVIQNRKTHLQKEMGMVSAQLEENQAEAISIDKDRQKYLKVMESKGALDDFLELQNELAKLEAEAAALREQFHAAELLEGEKTKLSTDRGNLLQRLQSDFKERKEALDDAILLVTESITELYDDRDGRFEISATAHGPEFEISIEGDRGGGISNMEIFCLDLALLNINAARRRGPGFLFHDSHLFDGVDERQVARALLLGEQATKGKNLQYIVALNSDIFDRLPLNSSIKVEDVVLKTRLSDKAETGGLFGMRFD